MALVAPSANPASAPAAHRPSSWFSVTVDVILAAAAYLGVVSLRYHGVALGASLPPASVMLPLLLISQIASLGVLQAYMRRSRIDWLLRVVAGVLAGTAVAAALAATLTGADRVSLVFLLDALLVAGAAVFWRIAWVFAARAKTRATSQIAETELVDRSQQLTTIRGVVLSLYGYRELLKNLVLKDVKLKYRGSVFGFLWSLANPLLMIIVYAIAFTFILRVRSQGFVFYLMLGQLSWTFFASSAAMSTGAVVDNSGLLKSVLFPRAILPICTVLFNLVQYLLTLAVFLPAMLLWFRVPLAGPMLLFPVFLMLQVLFTIGIALILATATAFFRDVRHLLEVALSVLFWTTPIVYELSHVPEHIQPLILLSPVASFVVAYQDLFYYRTWPDPMVWLVAAAYAFGSFAAGTLMFLSFEERFTEQL